MKNWKMKSIPAPAFWAGAAVVLLFLAQGIAVAQVLKATPDNYNFGTVPEGENAAIAVEIENTGNAPVEITNVQTSWACTEAVLGKHALNAGEKTTLEVTYETTGRPGEFKKDIVLTTNIPDQEKIEVFVMRGFVLEAPSAKIAVDPRRVVIEGAERDTGKKQAYAITNGGSLPLEITRIRLKDGPAVYFDGAVEGNLVIEPNDTRTVEIQLEPEPGTERVQKLILIECNARNAGESGYFLIVRYEPQ